MEEKKEKWSLGYRWEVKGGVPWRYSLYRNTMSLKAKKALHEEVVILTVMYGSDISIECVSEKETGSVWETFVA